MWRGGERSWRSRNQRGQIDGISDLFGELEIVSHEEEGEILFGLELEKELGDFLAAFLVEGAGRFVRKDQFGLIDEGSGDSGALFFAS